LLFDRAALRGVKSLLSLALNLLAALLLVVLAFHILKLTGESLDLVLVLIDLSLIHVEFSGHSLHLSGLLLKVLLIDGELLGDLRAGLSGKEILQLNVQLLLLLNDDVLLDDFLCFLNQTLLQGLDLLQHFPSVWVCTLKLSPTVIVKRVLELLAECLHLESLS